ncbi:cadherin-related family member 2-like [Halichoeres trimaculatus]|uniref:cadherin-related family member 2-like n=1 Tax=Halichoeres trimaculatus TaxID=147232 RepID=UPI003D9E5FCA
MWYDLEGRSNPSISDVMSFTVIVSDGVHTITQDTIISLLDANDNRPIFEEASYDFLLPENTAVGSSLFTVKASDQDTGLAGVISYSIGEVTPSSGIGLFGIVNDTGEVRLLGNLNNTGLSTFYSLQINATDGGGRCYFNETIYLSSVTYAYITVEGGLQFIGVPYVGSIEENSPLGTFVLNVTAASQNTGEDYKITYSIEDATVDGLFTISSDEGIISVLSEIDREESGDIVVLTIEATESNLNIHGVHSKVRTRVQISIIDVNDNKPEFYKCGYSCVKETHFTEEVYETIYPHIFLNMTIRDLDKHALNKLTLGGADKDVFSVPPEFHNWELWLDVRQPDKLDYEKTQQMIIEVIATDQDDTSLHSTATVTINIKDVNDNSPKFPQATYRLNVTEHADFGTVVANITATDADDPDTANSQIMFSIEESKYSDNFTIDPDTGVLRNSGELDREALDPELDGKIELNVTATDKGTPPLSTSVPVTIEVEDINDNKPQFAEASYQFSVKEGEKGAFVGSVTAEDLDQTSYFNRISFGIVGGSFGSFIIRTYEMERGYRGNITVDPEIHLDYESERKQFTLRVEAADLELLSAEVTVVVNVEDVNDERPEFLPTPTVSVKENTTIMEAVGRFTAEDKDTNHSLVYELESIECRCDGSMKPCNYFIVDPTGEVRVNPEVTVDYEECEQVVLEAQVVDLFTEKGENNSATPGRMEINIEDINDNIPEFIFSDYVFVVVSESAVKGTSVAGVVATDRDSGVNRQIEFEVTEVQFKDRDNQTINMKLLFEAVTTQQNEVYVGTIQTTEELDVSLKGKYLVTVTATDAGDLSTSTVLEILTAERSTVVVLEFSSSEEEVMKNLTDIIRELSAATEATVEIVNIRPVADRKSRSSGGTIIVAYFIDSNGTALTADEVENKISKSEHYDALKELGLVQIGSLPGPEPSNSLLIFVLGTLAGITVVLAGLTTTVIYTYKRRMRDQKEVKESDADADRERVAAQTIPSERRKAIIKILKLIWRRGKVVQQWQFAEGVWIPKEEDAKNIDHFRIISLLGVKGRIFFSKGARQLTDFPSSNGYTDTSVQKRGISWWVAQCIKDW